MRPLRRSPFFSRLQVFGLIVLVCLMASTVGYAQVSPGATRAEVIKVLGWPTNTSVSGPREILSYDECTVLLVHGKVVKLEYKSADSRQKILKQLEEPPLVVPPKPAVQPAGPPGVQPTAQPAVPVTGAVNPPTAPTTATADGTPLNRPASPAAPKVGPPPPPDPWAWLKMLGLLGAIIVIVIFIGVQKWLSDRKGLAKMQTELPKRDIVASDAAQKALARAMDPNAPRPDPILDGWSLELMKELEWHRFELVVAAYERELGYDARVTELGLKRVVDIRIFDKDTRGLKRMVQCRSDYQKVKMSVVRAFYDTMLHERIPDGTFYATEGFVPEAVEFAAGKGIELIDGFALVERIKGMDKAVQLRLFEIGTEGNYRTPTCVNCAVKMKLAGATTARPFWSCVNFPRCKNTLRTPRPFD